jgi:hypothetical protein
MYCRRQDRKLANYSFSTLTSIFLNILAQIVHGIFFPLTLGHFGQSLGFRLGLLLGSSSFIRLSLFGLLFLRQLGTVFQQGFGKGSSLFRINIGKMCFEVITVRLGMLLMIGLSVMENGGEQ